MNLVTAGFCRLMNPVWSLPFMNLYWPTDRQTRMNEQLLCIQDAFWVTWVNNPRQDSSLEKLHFIFSLTWHCVSITSLTLHRLVLVSVTLTSRGEAPLLLDAIGQWVQDLRGPHTGSQRSLPPWQPGSPAAEPTRDVLQDKKKGFDHVHLLLRKRRTNCTYYWLDNM